MSSRRWKPEQLEVGLAALSDELDRVYAPERALLTSGLAERIMACLPRSMPVLCRFARLLWLAVLIGSLTVSGLAAQMLIVRLKGPADISPLRAVIVILAAAAALALATMAPKVAKWQARRRSGFSGQIAAPAVSDVVMVRIAALALLAIAGVSVI